MSGTEKLKNEDNAEAKLRCRVRAGALAAQSESSSLELTLHCKFKYSGTPDFMAAVFWERQMHFEKFTVKHILKHLLFLLVILISKLLH